MALSHRLSLNVVIRNKVHFLRAAASLYKGDMRRIDEFRAWRSAIKPQNKAILIIST
jgi:hypothetical protein